MAYRRKDNFPKKVAGFVVAALVLAAAAVFLRRDDNAEPAADVPIYGTVTDTSLIVIDEETGVFDTASDDVITMPPLEEEPSTDTVVTRPVTPSRPAPRETPAPVSVVARQRAAAAIPRYESEMAKTRASPLLLNNYAWALHEAGRYSEAEQTLREVIRLAPNRAIAYANLGESLWKQGKNEEALAMYEKFLAMNSNPRRERIAQGKVAAIKADLNPR
jgi:tetratricopeptide (TPR) repeat protein